MLTPRNLILRSGLTVEELARRLGVSFDTVASWRIGRRKPCCRFMEQHLELVCSRAEKRKRKD